MAVIATKPQRKINQAAVGVIWPFQERIYEIVRGKARLVGSSPSWPAEFNTTVVVSTLLLVAGLVLVMVVHRLSNRAGKATANG